MLDDLKALQKREGSSLSRLASTLLAEALNERQRNETSVKSCNLRWNRSDLGARVDMADKDAVYRILDEG